MLRVFKHSIQDLRRSKWAYIYTIFYLLLSFGLLALTNDISQSVISILNIVLVLVPMLAMIFGVIYFYNSCEFTNLLLAQPLARRSIFVGQYLGLASTQILCLMLGILLPFSLFGVWQSPYLQSFLTMLAVGVFLTLIFSALAFVIGMLFNNRIKGFSFAVFVWLFLAVIYDGIFLVLLSAFRAYPLENLALGGVFLNPIDLSRILVLIHLDISALMGFTGAVFKGVLGNAWGMVAAVTLLCLWTWVPIKAMTRIARNKDF